MFKSHLEVVTGCMKSGKTEELIRQLRRACIAGLGVLIFKPAKDTRTVSNVESRNGDRLNAITVYGSNEILQHIDDRHLVIGIDEAHFFDIGLVDIAMHIVRRGKTVIVSGLDLDYKEKPFEVMSELMARAYPVRKLTAICQQCKADATRSQRLVDCNDRELIGDSEYEPRCLKCYHPDEREDVQREASQQMALPSFVQFQSVANP